MKSLKKSFTGKARSVSREEAVKGDAGANQNTPVVNPSNPSDSDGNESTRSLSDNPLTRWMSKSWPRQPKHIEDPTISQQPTPRSHEFRSQNALDAIANTSQHEESETSNPEKTTSEARRGRAILVTGNAIEIVGVVKIAADMTSVAGPLKATCGITERILATIKTMLQNSAAWDELVERMAQYLSVLQEESKKIEDKVASGASVELDRSFLSSLEGYLSILSKIHDQMDKERETYEKQGAQGLAAQAGWAKGNTETIQDLRTELEVAFKKIVSQLTVDIRDTTRKASNQTAQSLVLQLLPDIDAQGLRHSPLEPGTRQLLINRLTQWALDPEPSQQVFWLSDEAGTGKTTLATHMAQKWQGDGILAGRFFFDRHNRYLSSLRLFCLGLVKDIANLHPRSHASVLDVFRRRPALDTLDFDDQFQQLVLHVLSRLLATLRKPIVVVIDALDECETKGRIQLATALTRLPPTSSGIRVFLTSRRDIDIDEVFREASNICGKDACLLDIHSTERDDDISIYVDRALHSFNREQRQTVIDCARGHFLWASLACSALIMSPSPSGILQKMAKMQPNDTLRQLYEAVLDSALSDPDSLQLLKYVLQAIALAFQPISIFTMEKFNPPDPQQRNPTYVQIFVDRLASLMKDGTIYLPVHTLHPSFQQFLKEQPRDAKFYLAPDSGHVRIASACLDLLPTLRAGTWSHFVPPSRVIPSWAPKLPKVLEEGWEMPLRYAVTFWARHTSDALESPVVAEKLLRFFSQNFLAWAEWACAIREISEGLSALILLRKHLHTLNLLGVFDHIDNTLQKWCDDTISFLQHNQATIRERPDHVHTSALTFTPFQSLIHQIYFKSSPRELPTVLNRPLLRQSMHRALGGLWQGHRVVSCEFSPDGQRILILARTGDLRLWDANDGTQIKRLQGHGGILCAKFSRGGMFIASGGDEDHQVLVWEGRTGALLRELPRIHEGGVAHVVFTLEDNFIVSSSHDRRLIRWSRAVKHTFHDPCFENFTGPAPSQVANGLVASPEGNIVCSWYHDGTVALLNPETCSSCGSRRMDGAAAKVIFSYDGRKLIGGDWKGKVYIWDVETDIALHVLDAHEDHIYWLAVCADRTTLASGGLDRKGIRLWNIHTGKELCSPLVTHTGGIWGLAFSKKGRRLVSGSTDRTIRVWNLWQDGSNVSTDSYPLIGHTDRLHFVEVSPDGSKVVSVAEDATIRLWQLGDDLDVDAAPAVPEEGRLERMQYSRDGKVVLCSFSGGRMQLWDAITGQKIGQPMVRKDAETKFIQFSNRSDIFASGYRDGAVVVWRSSTEALHFASFELIGHQSDVMHIEFSSSGALLASSHWDKCIDIWALDLDRLVGTLAQRINAGGMLEGLTISLEETHLAYVTNEPAIYLWSIKHKRSVSRITTDESESDIQLYFSPDGKTLARSDEDAIDLYDFDPDNGLFHFARVDQGPLTYGSAFTEDSQYIYADTNFLRVSTLSRTTFKSVSLVGTVGRDDKSPLPPFIYITSEGHIVPLREKGREKQLAYLALPTDLKVERWVAHANQLALGLHDGTIMFVRIPLDFM
ncbi:WD40 repeat-like protein [Serendipita vermifera]|nr:WD40 repeat-like protein [Serendipita vermifera]